VSQHRWSRVFVTLIDKFIYEKGIHNPWEGCGGDVVKENRIRISVDIFCGRENPVFELKGAEAQRALKRLEPVKKIEKGKERLPPVRRLGYRGLIIEQTGKRAKNLPKRFRMANGDMFGRGLAHKAKDEAFEEFVCGSTPIKEFGPKFPDILLKEIERYRVFRVEWEPIQFIWPKLIPCRCAPLYEPDWWNDANQIRWNNNCYNYATNYRTDTFAQPGRAAGAMYTSLSCSSVKPAAVADELIDSPNADNKCPEEGHLVALAVWPGWDYHWYRMGRNEYWSHKPGGTQVTNVDNSGNTISDPRTADRGGYTDFCTFMVVMHGHIKIA
jgi:hypothetical protein